MPLKPDQEIMASAITALGVVAIFQHDTPNLADVQASAPGGAASANTHSSIKKAAWTSAVLVAGIGLLAKSPTIYVVGATVIVIETWKLYHANATGPNGQIAAPGSSVTGQPVPTLNTGS